MWFYSLFWNQPEKYFFFFHLNSWLFVASLSMGATHSTFLAGMEILKILELEMRVGENKGVDFVPLPFQCRFQMTVSGDSGWSTNSVFRDITGILFHFIPVTLPVSHLRELPRFRIVSVLFPNKHHNVIVIYIYIVGKHTQNHSWLFFESMLTCCWVHWCNLKITERKCWI